MDSFCIPTPTEIGPTRQCPATATTGHSSKRRTTSKCPANAAKCKGVVPWSVPRCHFGVKMEKKTDRQLSTIVNILGQQKWEVIFHQQIRLNKSNAKKSCGVPSITCQYWTSKIVVDILLLDYTLSFYKSSRFQYFSTHSSASTCRNSAFHGF